MKHIFVKSKFSFEDLKDKTVQFKISSVCGRGKFSVSNKKKDTFVIEIWTNGKPDGSRGIKFSRIPLPQKLVDCIQLHPDQAIALYMLDSSCT